MEYVTLNNWIEMPILWFWVYKVPQDETKGTVLNAINTWYRLIDTAQYYEMKDEYDKPLKPHE